MKRLLFIFFISMMMASHHVYAKNIQVGTYELSGETSFNYTDQTVEVEGLPDVDMTTTTIDVDALYYFIDNFGLGITISYLNTEIDNIDASTLLIGPQLLYNFSIGEKASFFLGGSVAFAAVEIDSEDADGWGWNVGGGLKYFINDHVSLNGLISYASITVEDDFNNEIETRGINIGGGFSIYFP